MGFVIACPQCDRQLKVTEDLQGRTVQCPACGTTFAVGDLTGSQPPVFAPPPGTAQVRSRRRQP